MTATPVARRTREGVHVIALYFAIVYFFPVVGNLLLGEDVISSYLQFPLTFQPLATLIGTFALFLILVRARPQGVVTPPGRTLGTLLPKARRTYGRLRVWIAISALIASIIGVSLGLTSYRYASDGIAARGSTALLVLMVLYVVATADLFYFMFVRGPVGRQRARRRFEHLLFASALVIGANGIATLLMALCTLWYAVAPRLFAWSVYVPREASRLESFGRAAIAIPLFIVIFGVGWYAGTMIKLSSGSDVSTLLDDPKRVANVAFTHDTIAESVAHYFVERTSVYYYSFLFTENTSREVLSYGESSALVFPLRTLLFRLDVLAGSPAGMEKPYIGSIMQLNYQLATRSDTIERGGTAPGLIAAFTYAVPFPLNVALCVVYLLWLAYALGDLLAVEGLRLSALGTLLTLQFVGGVFSSPFDWLIVLDNDVAFMLLLYILLRMKRLDMAGAWLRVAKPSMMRRRVERRPLTRVPTLP